MHKQIVVKKINLDVGTASQSIELFGLEFATGRVETFVGSLLQYTFGKNARTTTRRRPITILPTSMNDIVGLYKSPQLAQAMQQYTYRITDGMPLVWLARAKGARRAGRLYGPDFMRQCISQGRAYRLRHFFYGGTEAVLQKLNQACTEHYPGYLEAGSYAPPFRDLESSEYKAVVTQINRTHPDVVWIGIGSWRQVLFAQQLAADLTTSLVVPVGAAFDFISGTKVQAPRWIMRLGLEWLFRLLVEPGRLWQRYLLQIPLFIVFSIRDLTNYYKKNTSKSK